MNNERQPGINGRTTMKRKKYKKWVKHYEYWGDIFNTKSWNMEIEKSIKILNNRGKRRKVKK